MPCGCGQPQKDQLATMAMGSSPDLRGMYALRGYPGCAESYRGRLEGTSVYVVGRGSEHEKLFRRDQLHEASDHSKATRLIIENLPSAMFCKQAVEDLYAEAST